MAEKNISLFEIVLLILVLILAGSNIYFVKSYLSLKEKAFCQKEVLPFNKKALDFLKLFVKEVLKAEKEVDFETRLKLENSVREIGDKEVLEIWQKFVESQTEEEAQRNVKDLLEILAKKISP